MGDQQLLQSQSPNQSRSESLSGWIAFACLTIGIFGFAAHNLGNRYFWTDESSSLFTSLGWPGVGERSGSIAGAWNWTMATHVEPGLYNMLERFWALGVGTEITTLRIYPFMFFLIYLSAIAGIGRLLRLPWFLIAGIIGLLLLENITPYYAVELRPSSAGLAASVALPFLALLLFNKTKAWMLIAFVVGVMVVGSMQYNSYPLEFATGVVLVGFGLLRSTNFERTLLAGAGIFSIAWLPAVYLVTRGNPKSVAHDSQLAAIPEALIPNMELPAILNLIQQNLLSFTALPRTLFLVLVPILWLVHKWPTPWSRLPGVHQSVNQLWLFTLVATCATAAVGFAGVMPWIVGTRWSIAEIGLIGISLLGIGAVLVQLGLLRLKPILVAALITSVAVSMLAGYRLFTYERFSGHNWNDVLPMILQGTPGKTVVDTKIYTDLRYWIELSGDYDSYRDAWIAHRIQTTSEFRPADETSVIQFLNSNQDRLLLSDVTLIERAGINMPDNVTLIRVPAWDESQPTDVPQPVLLVR